MFIIKIFGLIILSLTGLLLGSKQVARLKKRSDALYWFSANIPLIGEHIRGTGEEIYDIVNTLCGKDMFLTLEKPFRVKIKDSFLDTYDLEALYEFFGELGRLDCEAEIKRCEMYSLIISDRYKRAHKEYLDKNKLYKMLGLFSGLSVAIIIM